MKRIILSLIALIQIALGMRFVLRTIRTLNGKRISHGGASDTGGGISIIVPVLNEAARIRQCLESLSAQGEAVTEIIVVDGGSSDGTTGIVSSFISKDSRIRLVPAPELPDGWNGKAWGLQVGLDAATTKTRWILTVDADVQAMPGGPSRLASFAAAEAIPFLSIATGQRVSTPGLAIIHPSLLATLVYRFGIPGHRATSIDDVQANGQFALYDNRRLRTTGGFAVARDSICEDVTLARHLFLSGYEVGFFEGPDIAETEMYASGSECLSGWTRSLTLRDRFAPSAGINGLINMLFLQVVPIIAVIVSPSAVASRSAFGFMARFLLGCRLGVLVGTRRAYRMPSILYWVSPLADPVCFIAYFRQLVRRNHVWRGRTMVVRER
jgi:dolichol-phosphate mannosyltransferase